MFSRSINFCLEMDANGNWKPMERTTIYQSPISYQFGWNNNYAGMRCELFDKKWLDCASKLGLVRAERECIDALNDREECSNMSLAYKRYVRMQEERIKRGLPFQDPPPYDTMHYDKFKNLVP
jgi:hypothetical protein